MHLVRDVYRLAMLVALLLPAFGLTSVTLASGIAPEARTTVPQDPAGYVGTDTCLTCHSDKDYKGEPHGQAENPRSPAGKRGCETCHGPGKEHVDGSGDVAKIRNPAKLPNRDVSALCTTCHNRGEHAFWEGGQHDRRGLTCTTCHSNHSPKSATGRLVAKTQQEVCGRCHRDKVAKLDRSGHMPVREGKMQCSTCHTLHGSQNVRLLRVGYSISEACTSCHAEKRGPYLWEHPRCGRTARPATTRTGRPTSGCCRPRCRSSASAATSTPATRPRSMTPRASRRATACTAAGASSVIRPSTGPCTRRA